MSVIDKWLKFCSCRSITENNATVVLVTDFLLEQFKRGLGASAIDTYGSALSMYLPKVEGYVVGEHPDMIRFMRGIKNQRPSHPRYTTTWDTDLVIKFLKGWDVSSLKNLTLKVTMLLALITAQRAQTLSKLKISEMRECDGKLIFRIGESLKTRAPGTAVVELKAYPEDRLLCPVVLIKAYIDATKNFRTDDELIISFIKPHRVVHVDTFRRWITSVMGFAGIDTEVYKPHSTRAASTSKAKEKHILLENIMAAAMWNNASTFAKFYDKEIVEQDSGPGLVEAILNVG